jgi:hypothetical protein
MELSAEQILLLGLVSSGVSQLLKIVVSKLGYNPGRIAVNVVLFIVASALSFIWARPELPPIDDPMAFAIALSEAAVAVFGFASLAYNILLKQVVFPALRLG